jgi:hypothetical protein
MFRPPHDPQDPPRITNPTWRSILVSYALVVTIPLLLWAVTNPLAGTVTLAGVVGLVIGGRHAYKLHRCFYHCQKLTFQLGETAQITVTQLPTDDAN